jgi:hypothetical protein
MMDEERRSGIYSGGPRNRGAICCRRKTLSRWIPVTNHDAVTEFYLLPPLSRVSLVVSSPEKHFDGANSESKRLSLFAIY